MRPVLVFAVLLVIGSAGSAQDPAVELVLQTGHTAEVTAIALSRDGKHIVTGSMDTVSVWDVKTGKKLRNFEGAFLRAFLSADGTKLATVSIDNAAILWDTTSGKKIHTFRKDVGMLLRLAMSADASRLVTVHDGGRGGSIILWDASTGKELRTITDKKGPNSVAISGDGKRFLVSTGGGAVLHSTTEDKSQALESGFTSAAALSEDGKVAAILSLKGIVTLWDTASGEKLRTFQEKNDRFLNLAISSDGKHLVAATKGKKVIVWRTSDGQEMRFFENPTVTTSLALSKDGKQVATGCADGSTLLRDVGQDKFVQAFQGRKSPSMLHMAASGDGQRLIVGSQGKAVAVWHVGARQPVILPHDFWVFRVAISDDGKTAATAMESSPPSVWDLSAKTARALAQQQRVMSSLALSRDGKFVVSSDEGAATLWEAASGKKLQVFAMKGLFAEVAISDDGKQVLIGSGDGTANLWESGGKKLGTIQLPEDTNTVTLSGDGKLALTGAGREHRAVLLDAAKGNELQTFEGPRNPQTVLSMVSVALTGDGKRVVTGALDGKAIVWDAATGKKLAIIQHTGPVRSVAISRDGKHLWTATTDGVTYLWDPATGKERCRLFTFDDGKDWLVVTPDGLFDGSPGAWSVVSHVVAGTLTPVEEKVTRRRFRSGLLEKVWKGEL